MYYIGIDVGGMSIKGGIVSEEGKILHKSVVETRESYDENYSISLDIKRAIDELLDSSNIGMNEIKGIGIGEPGSIDYYKGIVRYSNNIAITNIHVVKELKAYYDVPIFIDNDANCAALGEYVFGEAKSYKNILFVTLGTGIGTGILTDGVLLRGNGNAGAEGGHTVIRMNGNRCNCGRRGCYETYASVTALIRDTKIAMDAHPESLMWEIAKNEGKINGKVSFAAAKMGDKTALSVVKRYIKYVSEGLTNLVNIFRPDVVIIGGGISFEGEYLTKPIERYINRNSFGSKYNPKTKVIPASLTNDAGILGAAALLLAK